jgi:hypothetical protein
MESRRPIKVFYSYAHEDREWLKRLDRHLAPFKQQGRITVWDDSAIQPGTEWTNTIDQQLSTSDIILLLISDHYLASQFCSTVEMAPAIELHARGKTRAIPILLSPVIWWETPLAHLQVLPGNRMPITLWNNSDEALTNIAVEIGHIVDGMLP